VPADEAAEPGSGVSAAGTIVAPPDRDFTRQQTCDVDAVGDSFGCRQRTLRAQSHDAVGCKPSTWSREPEDVGALEPSCVPCSNQQGGLLSQLGKMVKSGHLASVEAEMGRLVRLGIVRGGGGRGWDE